MSRNIHVPRTGEETDGKGDEIGASHEEIYSLEKRKFCVT